MDYKEEIQRKQDVIRAYKAHMEDDEKKIKELEQKLAESERFNNQLNENMRDVVRDSNIYFEQKTELANERNQLEQKLSEALEVIEYYADYNTYNRREEESYAYKARTFLKLDA